MPQLPVEIENDFAIQNNTTGQVDYLQFQGNTLTQSAMFDYGIPGMNIVSSDVSGPTGFYTMVAQNPTTGVVDFLGLNNQGNLVSSAMSSSLPSIVGHGDFGSAFAGQSGDDLVSQLPNGQLDILAFNSSGTLISSDLVANSIGLPHVVGAAVANNGNPTFEAFAGVGTNTHAFNVITQLADGSLDAIGFSGDFNAGTVSVSNSFLLPGSAGSATVGAVNQDFATGDENTNIFDAAGHEGVQMVTQLASGQMDLLTFDAGYNDPANEGVLYASSLLNLSLPGWHVVDAGTIADKLFPVP
jgi:hypothetical protein